MEKFFAGTPYKFSGVSFNPASCKTHVIGSYFIFVFIDFTTL